MESKWLEQKIKKSTNPLAVQEAGHCISVASLADPLAGMSDSNGHDGDSLLTGRVRPDWTQFGGQRASLNCPPPVAGGRPAGGAPGGARWAHGRGGGRVEERQVS